MFISIRYGIEFDPPEPEEINNRGYRSLHKLTKEQYFVINTIIMGYLLKNYEIIKIEDKEHHISGFMK